MCHRWVGYGYSSGVPEIIICFSGIRVFYSLKSMLWFLYFFCHAIVFFRLINLDIFWYLSPLFCEFECILGIFRPWLIFCFCVLSSVLCVTQREKLDIHLSHTITEKSAFVFLIFQISDFNNFFNYGNQAKKM